MKGCYCLIISLSKSQKLNIGSLYQNHKFKKGWYVYIGSAMNSLVPRIKRHLSDDKKMHWHIDYLLKNENATVKDVLFCISDKKVECELANYISQYGEEIDKFGCSDCNCKSHLIYFNRKKDALTTVKNTYKTLNIEFKDLKYFRKELE